MGAEAVWEEALGYIEGKVPRQVFETWFIPIHFDGIGGSSARLAVPNKFFGEWLGQHHGDLLSQALAKAQGRGADHIEIEFIVGPKPAERSAAHLPAEDQNLSRSGQSG